MSMLPTISIIVPVFNAEKSLSRTLKSLETQTYRLMEIILVDDCSTDGSLKLIQAFASRMNLDKSVVVKVVIHANNMGVANARNSGIEKATGDYIYYVDADDTIDTDAIECLVEATDFQRFDIVGCSWCLSFATNERTMNQPIFFSPWDAIQKILKGKMRWNLWLYMVRRSIYRDNKVRFVPGKNMGEDLLVMIKLFAYAKKVTFVNKALYHYDQSNEQSLTRIYSSRHIDEVTSNVYDVEDFLLSNGFQTLVSDNIMFLKLSIKQTLLISNKWANYRLWLNWFPEANPYAIWNKNQSNHIRLLQWAALYRQYWLIYLYHQLVVKFVYGILYR